MIADLLEKPAIALLVVSDNSASGESLVLRTQEQKDIYNATRFDAIPKILMEIAKR